MFEAHKLMERGVTTVNPNTHIYVAMNLLVKEGLSGIPVVNSSMKLVGFLSEKDVLQLLMLPEAAESGTVADYMTLDVHSFESSDSAVDICDYFMNYGVHIIPIVDGDRFVGIVKRRDIIFLILRLRGKIFRKR